MAKYKKWRRYRRYYRKKKISENYFRAKVEASGVIYFSENPVEGQQTGIALMNIGDGGVQRLTFRQILESTTYNVMLSGMFSFWRLTGMAIEVVPASSNSGGNKIISDEGPIYIAPRAGTNDAMNYSELKSINSAILMNPLQSTRKYTKFYGYYGDWISTDSYPQGAISIAALSGGLRANKPEWTFKVTCYLLYKKSKI